MKSQPKPSSERPAPVSLHPLTAEQALGALLRTPQPRATEPVKPTKSRRRKERKNKVSHVIARRGKD
jgi:hypothetical protein